MKIKYRILSINPEEHSMLVRFSSDTLSELDLAASFDELGNITHGRTDVNITIWQTPAPSAEQLHEEIMRQCPMGFFEIKQKVMDPNVDTSMDALKDFVGVEVEQEIDRYGPQQVFRLVPGTKKVNLPEDHKAKPKLKAVG
jgi:hypothetical protein